MKVTVKSPLKDILAFLTHVRKRRAIFRRTSSATQPSGRVNQLSAALHPPVQTFTVISRTEETPTSATFRLSPADGSRKVAAFRAGQYLSVEARVDGVWISRPFSIASPPEVSYRENYYELTVRTKDDGFLAPWIMQNWKVGSTVQTSDPQGYFYYDNLRDRDEIVCLAGGSGVTPFRSMIPDLLDTHPDAQIVLLYGVTSAQEIIYRAEWEALARRHPDRFRFVPVCSGDAPEWSGERGFLSAALIGSHVRAPDNATFFLCGPAAMQTFLTAELAGLSLRHRQVRRENFGGGATTENVNTAFAVSVQVEGAQSSVEVAADPAETVLVALERAGLNPPALCRSGDCGWCRAQLLDGSVHIPDGFDHRRAGDRKFGYFHPCSSWPKSDLVIRLPRNPKHT